jgi:L-asparagine transporter-like permease
MWLFPWASYVAIGGMLAVLWAMASTPARAIELRMSLLALAFTLLCFWILRGRASARIEAKEPA